MYDGYLALAGTELINNERTTTYAAALGIAGVGCFTCTTPLHEALEEKPYTTAEQDDAPWWDPHFPHSGRFAGFLGMGFDGFGGTASRSPVSLREGSMVGLLRRGQREIGVTCLAVAADDEALSYGLAWLASALRGGVCISCRGDNVCLFASCPTGTGERQFRNMYDVGLLEGPTAGDYARLGATCEGDSPGVLATVEYTLVAGTPYLYHTPVTMTFPKLAAVSGVVDPPADCPDDVGPCPKDPCNTIPARPKPPTPVDPCECKFTSGVGAVLSVPAVNLGRWTETVTVVKIYTGSADMKCVRVRYYRNPRDPYTTCKGAGLNDPCEFCDALGISFIPKGSSLIIDGRTKSVVLDCSDTAGPAPLGPYLYTAPGKAYSWSALDCPGGMCVEFLAAQAATDATITLQVVEREDAG